MILYMVATPIGNLDDLTLRALKTLKEVDIIAAEDTRVSKKLLSHFQISKKLVSIHEHSKAKDLDRLIKDILTGQKVAYITDAGTPQVSDPGRDLVKLAFANGIKVSPIPGACAVTAALSVCPIAGNFRFLGFLPKEKSYFARELTAIIADNHMSILFETPHRIIDTLTKIKELAPSRKIFIARELTKLYEDLLYGNADELLTTISTNGKDRGEFVVIIEGASKKEFSEEEVITLLKDAMKESRLKDAVEEIAKGTETSKKKVYELALKIKERL